MATAFLPRLMRKVFRTCFRRPPAPVHLSFNDQFLRREHSDAEIETDALHAVKLGFKLSRWLGDPRALRGKTLLEVGPGHNFGSVLFLAGHGVIPAVADRFLMPWSPEYHPRFYRRFRAEMKAQYPDLDTRIVSAVIDANGYPESILRQDANGLETLSLPNDSFDYVVSNAVLEHLDDFPRSFAQLYRVTRPGGWNQHQVDFRYHPSFDRPLEHLLLSPQEFQRQSRACLRESGTYHRPFELAALFEKCGFTEVVFHVNQSAQPEYFQDFLTRLSRCPASAYHKTPAEMLSPIGGSFRVRKPH